MMRAPSAAKCVGLEARRQAGGCRRPPAATAPTLRLAPPPAPQVPQHALRRAALQRVQAEERQAGAELDNPESEAARKKAEADRLRAAEKFMTVRARLVVPCFFSSRLGRSGWEDGGGAARGTIQQQRLGLKQGPSGRRGRTSPVSPAAAHAAPAPPPAPPTPPPQIGTGEATCKGCGYEYTPKRGDPEYPVAPGTPFQASARLPAAPPCAPRCDALTRAANQRSQGAAPGGCQCHCVPPRGGAPGQPAAAAAHVAAAGRACAFHAAPPCSPCQMTGSAPPAAPRRSCLCPSSGRWRALPRTRCAGVLRLGGGSGAGCLPGGAHTRPPARWPACLPGCGTNFT